MERERTSTGAARYLPVFALPDLSLVRSLWPGALGIAPMSFTESIASARAFMKHGDPKPEPDQELLTLGIANIGGGFFRAMPAGGGTLQTAVNAQAGTKTQLAGIITAVAVIITLLFLAPLISLMPEAALGALVLVAAAGLVKVGEFRGIARIRKIEFWWTKPHILVADLSAVPDIEYTALKMLTELEEKLEEQGISLWLAVLNPEPLKIIQNSPLGKKLGRERMFFKLE